MRSPNPRCLFCPRLSITLFILSLTFGGAVFAGESGNDASDVIDAFVNISSLQTLCPPGPQLDAFHLSSTEYTGENDCGNADSSSKQVFRFTRTDKTPPQIESAELLVGSTIAIGFALQPNSIRTSDLRSAIQKHFGESRFYGDGPKRLLLGVWAPENIRPPKIWESMQLSEHFQVVLDEYPGGEFVRLIYFRDKRFDAILID